MYDSATFFAEQLLKCPGKNISDEIIFARVSIIFFFSFLIYLYIYIHLCNVLYYQPDEYK